MQTIISGTDKELYDMIVKLHDEAYTKKNRNFLICITITKDVDLSVLQDFVSLAKDMEEDWKSENMSIQIQIKEECTNV